MILSQAGITVTRARHDGGVKLSEWARLNGVSRQSATRWFHAGVLPVGARQLATGTIVVDGVVDVAAGVAICARVSWAGQRSDLDRRVACLVEHVTTNGMSPTGVVCEVGSGLDGYRTELLGLRRDPSMGAVVVGRRDRLAGFGVGYLEAALAGRGRRLEVVEETEVTDDVGRDMVEVATGLWARLYGRRSAERRAESALAAAGKAAA